MFLKYMNASVLKHTIPYFALILNNRRRRCGFQNLIFYHLIHFCRNRRGNLHIISIYCINNIYFVRGHYILKLTRAVIIRIYMHFERRTFQYDLTRLNAFPDSLRVGTYKPTGSKPCA